MFLTIFSSILSLSSLSSSCEPYKTPQAHFITATDHAMRIHYGSSFKIKDLSQQVAYYLSQDVRGNFIDFQDSSELKIGDILVFGSSQEEIDRVGIYQGNDECMYIAIDGKTAIIAVDSLNKWNEHFFYCGYYRPETSSSEMAVAAPMGLISWDDLFSSQYITPQRVPFVLTPRRSSFHIDTFINWAESRQWQLQSLLNEHGALLLRNFPAYRVEDFKAIFAATVAKNPIDYIGEGSRNKIIDGVYTSTEGPPEFPISLHHELSCTQHPASYISFYCEMAPEEGTGQTILGKTVTITRELHKKPNVWKFFEGKNIKYVSRHPPEGNFFTKVNKTHKTWPQVFETTDKQEIEKICKKLDLQYEWDDEWLVLTRIAPAIRPADEHFPFSYWYNQLHLFHANPRSRGGFFKCFLANLLYIIPSTKQYEVTLEDDTTIDYNIVYDIYDVLEAASIKFDWQKGDILVLDNRTMMHGRAPSQGKRRILVSMTD